MHFPETMQKVSTKPHETLNCRVFSLSLVCTSHSAGARSIRAHDEDRKHPFITVHRQDAVDNDRKVGSAVEKAAAL